MCLCREHTFRQDMAYASMWSLDRIWRYLGYDLDGEKLERLLHDGRTPCMQIPVRFR